MNKLLCTILALVLLISAAGCGGDESKSVRVDVQGNFSYIDPQFTGDDVSLTVVKNCFEGLMKVIPGGDTVCAAAESFSVSSDGTEYTFKLKKDAMWSNSVPVTSDDFIFAFERIFSGDKTFASKFSDLTNYEKVVSGELEFSQLGISAPDEYTLVFSLSAPSPNFCRMLAESCAVPCNREFFLSTKARYGMNAEYLIYNGPFALTYWDSDDYLRMSKNTAYYDADSVKLPHVFLYINRKDSQKRFSEGYTDCCIMDYQTAQSLSSKKKYTKTKLDNQVLALVFNGARKNLSSTAIREAILTAIEADTFVADGRLTDNYTLINSLVPAGAREGDIYYTERFPNITRQLSFAGTAAKTKLMSALAGQGIKDIPVLNLTLVDESGLSTFAGNLQKQWQTNLSLFVNLKVLSEAEAAQAVGAGDYDMALMLFTCEEGDPYSVLSSFCSDSAANCFGFVSSEYDELVRRAFVTEDNGQALDLYRNAEKLLLDEAAVWPIFSQSAYFVLGEGVSGIEYERILYFKDGYRK